MKKKNRIPFLVGFKKFLRIMRITAAIVFILSMHVYAESFGQVDKINLKMNSNIKEVFEQLEKVSNYRFVLKYDQSFLDKQVDINYTNEKFDKVLDDLLKGTGFTYKVIDRYIAIVPIGESNDFSQQQKSVSGKVTDSSRASLPGVSVVVKGTTNGTITDSNGNYSLPNVPENGTLQFSFVGMKGQEVAVGGKTTINVILEDETIGVEEVVVIGYGTQKKANLTGAVGSDQMDDMESRPLTNASLALQGTVAGVYALQSSGKPGDDHAVIDIRGVGTFGSNMPLIIIDGFPGSMSDVNANDIKSISVLKDAASSSIYGNRAANGVILITTKKGASGEMKISYNGYFGVQNATRLPSVLNSVEFATLQNEASVNSGRVPNFTDADIQKFAAHNDPMYPDIDYFKVYYGQANTQNHRLSMTGGTENLQYAFMLGQLDQDGIMVATNYKKTDFRSNIDAYFLKDKKLRLSTKLAGNLGVKGEPTSLWNATWYATTASIYPLQNADGQYMTVNGELNPYGSIKAGTTAQTKRYNFSGQVEAEYKILKDLSAQVT